MSVSDFAFFGRLHPLVLHAPIGFLLAALVLELMAARARLARPALGLFLGLAALSAVLAAATGWVLGHEDGYGGATLERHEQLGIAVALAASATALLHVGRARIGLWPYRAALALTCALLFPAGHLGSELTHGSDWLEGPRAPREPVAVARLEPAVEGTAVSTGAGEEATEDTSTAAPASAPEPAAAGSGGAYDAVADILAARCTSCHGPTKHKGGLRLDSLEAMLAGGDAGPALVPGDPGASLFLQRSKLPLEHEDHMPPEGKPQPSAEELARLEGWVAASAPKGAGAARPREAGTAAGNGDLEAAAPAPAALSGPSAEALAALARALVHHERLVPERPELAVDVAAIAPSFGDAEVRTLLVPLAPWIAELSLARSAVTDAVLPELARFPRLARLDLCATAVSATGLAALEDSALLVELELARTRVGDAAIESLLALPALERLALWDSGLSPEGLARLRSARPALLVNAGDEPPAEVLEVEGELAFTSDRPQPGAELVPAALRPVNATCPVSGSPVNSKYSLVHGVGERARVIGFCCPNCPGEFWRDPARFESKLP